jgi:hypothetical protein
MNTTTATLADQITTARVAGYGSRDLAKLALPKSPMEHGSSAWKLAGRINRIEHGATPDTQDYSRLGTVLDAILKPAAPSVKLSDGAMELFTSLVKDSGNWSGSPIITVTPQGRGYLTSLKRKGLLTTGEDEGVAFAEFTEAGVAFADELGLGEYLGYPYRSN